jgi:hypothetical protein
MEELNNKKQKIYSLPAKKKRFFKCGYRLA